MNSRGAIIMKKLLNRVNYQENDNFVKINHLLHSNKKIGIFGAGIYAEYLENILNKWGISIDFCVVDDEYYDTAVSNGKKPIRLSELKSYGDVILIIGFEKIIEKEDFLKAKILDISLSAPNVEIMDFENCYLDWDYIDYPFFLNHYEEFEKAYDLLADDFSRKVMLEYLNASISGKADDFDNLKTDHLHDYEHELIFEKTVSGDVILECGAYNGKTAIEIAETLNDRDISATIVALEPDENNIKILKDKCKNYPNIILESKGVYSKDGTIYFCPLGDQGGKIVNTDEIEDISQYIAIDVISIDTLGEKYGSIAAILMDIEGSELDALKGGTNIITKYKPALAIRVYHKKTDLLEIPVFLDSLLPHNKYKLYLRNNANGKGLVDLTLYAV